MAQCEVNNNPSGSATAGIPYVVVVQSDLLDALATRLTLPLAVLDVATKVPTVLCPAIRLPRPARQGRRRLGPGGLAG